MNPENVGNTYEHLSFIDKDGVITKVLIGDSDSYEITTALTDVVEIVADNGEQCGKFDSIFIHKQDIPKLIKVLEEAYKQMGA
jgi:hypothetical protein